jgi:signal peptidase I
VVRGQISTVLWALVIALLVRSLVIETYYVPSESMLPTLLVGDHMLVNKFAFGARIPFTEIRLPALREPKRGDVVTFVLGRQGPGRICPVDRCPDHPRGVFVKRIVGLPADTIEVLGDRVVLNGQPLRSEYGPETFVDDAGEKLRMGTEFLGDSPHAVLDHPRRKGSSQVRITVPEGRYFVMGDNRDNSNDSRGWGTIRRADIKGPVMMIYWSWNNRASWWSMLNPVTWWRLLLGETRWDRFGMRVE